MTNAREPTIRDYQYALDLLASYYVIDAQPHAIARTLHMSERNPLRSDALIAGAIRANLPLRRDKRREVLRAYDAIEAQNRADIDGAHKRGQRRRAALDAAAKASKR